MLCYSSAMLNNSLVQNDAVQQECVVDLVNFLLQLMVFLIILLVTIWVYCLDQHQRHKDFLVLYEEHSSRWILCLCLIGIHMLECGEGLFYVQFNERRPPLFHIVVNPVSSLLCTVAAIVFYHYIEKWNRPKLLFLLLLYWPLSAFSRVAKISVLYGMGLTIFHLRLQVAWAAMLFYCLLSGLEITLLLVQRYLCRTNKKEDLDENRVDISDVQYLHSFVSLFARATFSWLLPLLRLGYRKPLELADLGVLPENDMAEFQFKRFNDIFMEEKESTEKKGKKLSLWKCMWRTFWRTLFLGGIVKIMGDIVGLVGPLSISIILAYIVSLTEGNLPYGTLQNPYYPTTMVFLQNGFVMCIVVLVATFLQSTFSNNFNHLAIVEGIHLRTSMQCLVYKKALRMSCAAGLDTGALVNHMSVDPFNLMMLFSMGHYIWAVPVKIILLLVLLHMHLGYSALIGAATIYVLAPVQYYICRLLSKIQKNALSISDERLKRTTEILQGIKLLKLYGWESMYAKLVEDVREKELAVLRKDAIYTAINTFITQGTSIVVTLVTFGLYSQIEGKPLTPSDVFTGLALFNQLTVPLYIIPVVIPMVINAIVSTERLLNFLLLPEVDMSLAWRVDDDADVHSTKFEFKPDTGSVLLHVRDNSVDSRVIGSDESDGVFLSDFHLHTTAEDQNVVSIKSGYFSHDVGVRISSLRDVNVQIPAGKMTIVVGSIGSGKTSLLSALLGELHVVSGSLTWHSSPLIAYVPQRPWLMNATLKENILFGEPYDGRRYHQVVQACALQPDIDLLPARDLTEIGERGLNLSGGQRQRIALARAFYSPARMILLDDPLSALDAHVGAYVFEHGVKTLLLRRNRTVILVTHKMEFMSAASKVIVMESGTIKLQGPVKEMEAALHDFNFNVRKPKRLLKKGDTFASPEEGTTRERHKLVRLLSKQSLYRTASTQEVRPVARLMSLSRQMSHDPSSPLPCHDWGDHDDPLPHDSDQEGLNTGHKLRQSMRSIESLRSRSSASSNSINRHSWKCPPSRLNSRISTRTEDLIEEEDEDEDVSEKNMSGLQADQIVQGKLIKAEDREKGKISKKVYLTYMKACTFSLSLLVVVLICGCQAMKIGTDFWLSEWSEASESSGSNYEAMRYYIAIYAALSVASIILAFVTNLASQLTSLKAVRVLHYRMLHNIVQCPMRFFDSTPVGRIVNRFSSDISTIDKKLPVTLPMLLRFLLLCLSAILVDVIVTPYFIIAIIPLGAIYYFLQHFFRFTSRELQRLDSITKSPIFSHFSETVGGLCTIRAFRAERRFTETIMACINVNNAAFVLVNCANCWLGISLDYLGGVILFLATVSSMLAAIYGDVSPSFVGIAMTYTLLVPIYLNWVVRNLASTEMYMSAVERVNHYTKLPIEVATTCKQSSAELLKNWPSQGEISIFNTTLKYEGNSDPVLKNVSLMVKAGEKVGICGRTGSGKSSLAMALFRMVSICDGKIEIDGIDITTVPLQFLRSKLSVIPQESIVFSGTVRENLDPGQEYAEDELWSALEAAQMKHLVVALPGGLDSQVSEESSNFSAGQHQLFCLARALLRKSKILVMDEATSSLDPETDTVLQNVVAKHFADCTVLSIAHRVQSLLNFNKVVVLESGRLAEVGSPQELMNTKGSIFASLVKASQQHH